MTSSTGRPLPPHGEHSAGRRAFTLIELLVVIGIIGLLAVTSVPAFSQYTRQVRLKTFTRDVAGLLAVARQQAISSRQERTIVYDSEEQRLLIEESLDDDEPRIVKVPKGVTITMDGATEVDEDAGGQRFAFQPSGALGGRSVSVIVTSQGRSRTVLVTGATGTIAVRSADGA